MSDQLHEYIGVAMSNISDGVSKVIHVLVPELAAMVSGDQSDSTKGNAFDIETVDILVNPDSKTPTRVKTIATVPAAYIGGGNTTVPCVYAGEYVRVLRYGNLHEFFWLPLGKNSNVRRNERYRVFCSDVDATLDGSGNVKQLGDNNTYYLEIDTRKGMKHIRLSTADSDGEEHRYVLDICPEDSSVLVSDELGNKVEFKTNETSIQAINAAGSMVHLKSKDVDVKAIKTLNVTAPTINMVGDDVTLQANKSLTINSPTLTNIVFNNATYSVTGVVQYAGASFTVGSSHGVVGVQSVTNITTW